MMVNSAQLGAGSTGGTKVRSSDPGVLFNNRFDIIIKFIFIAYAILFCAACLMHSLSILFMIIHLMMYLSAITFYFATVNEYSSVKFLIIHPFVMYSFTIFFYADLYSKSPEENLYAPILSSGIALAALLAAIMGYFGGVRAARMVLPPEPEFCNDTASAYTSVVMICGALPLAMLPYIVGESNFINAVSGVFEPVLWLCVIVYCRVQRSMSLGSPVIIGVGVISFGVSVALNGRSFLLSFILTMFFVYLGLAKRALTLGRLVLAYFVVNILGAFSQTILTVRTEVGRENAAAMVQATLDSFFSFDFLLMCLGLKHGSAHGGVEDQLSRRDEYLLYIFDGRLGLPERLTQLPHMDIVMSRLPWPAPVDWSEIRNAILSALPSVGQPKDLIFNDRLVWDYQLMKDGNVGHPLVTAAGEFYAMGGFPVEMLAFGVVVAGIIIFFELSKRVFRDHFIASAALLVFSIFLVFSSTSLSALAVPLRIYPITLMIYAFGTYLFQAMPKRLQRSPGP